MRAELFDGDGYPTEEALDDLRDFDGTAAVMLSLIEDRWNTNYGLFQREPYDNDGTKAVRLRLVTGGWSGNEAVISALQRTMFWIFFWHLSRRGGLHEFVVDDNLLDCPLTVLPR